MFGQQRKLDEAAPGDLGRDMAKTRVSLSVVLRVHYKSVTAVLALLLVGWGTSTVDVAKASAPDTPLAPCHHSLPNDMLGCAYAIAGNVCAENVMRTTLNIDDDVLRTVQEETGARTKTQAVHEALKDYVRRRKIEKLIELQGKVRFSADAKTLRKGWERNRRGSR